jgi:hypothetical protein
LVGWRSLTRCMIRLAKLGDGGSRPKSYAERRIAFNATRYSRWRPPGPSVPGRSGGFRPTAMRLHNVRSYQSKAV